MTNYIKLWLAIRALQTFNKTFETTSITIANATNRMYGQQDRERLEPVVRLRLKAMGSIPAIIDKLTQLLNQMK